MQELVCFAQTLELGALQRRGGLGAGAFCTHIPVQAI